MELKLLGRGLLAGAFAGLLMFVFVRIVVEPVIEDAIDYEAARESAQETAAHHAASGAHEHGTELVSRAVQMNIGSGVGLILFGAAMGTLVAIVYAVAIGRTGNIRPFPLALLVPAFFFVGVFLVPFAKYPANPPAVSRDGTVTERGISYLVLVLCSCLLLFAAVYVGQKVRARSGPFRATLVAGAAYLFAMGVVFALLPTFHETPSALVDESGNVVLGGFPAETLAQFRVYAVAAQAVLWAAIALTFAPLAERLLQPASTETADDLISV